MRWGFLVWDTSIQLEHLPEKKDSSLIHPSEVAQIGSTVPRKVLELSKMNIFLASEIGWAGSSRRDRSSIKLSKSTRSQPLARQVVPKDIGSSLSLLALSPWFFCGLIL